MIGRLGAIVRSRHFWFILAMLVLCTIMHYAEQMGIPLHFGLSRHAMDRTLYLLPIIYSSFVFGMTAGVITLLAAVSAMIPRAILISSDPASALAEIACVALIGVLTCLWLRVRGREREQYRFALTELEAAHQELQAHIRVSRSNEKRLATLNAMSTVLCQSLELKEIFRRAIDMVMEVMEVEVVLIFSLDEQTQELVLLAYEGVSNEFAQGVDRMKLGEEFNGRVASSGEPLMVADASHDPRLSRPVVRKMKIQAQLVVPMKFKGRVIGTLCIAMRRPRQFLPEEVDLATAIGNQIGISIENARLYEKERLIAEQLRRSEGKYRQLFETAHDAIWVHDLVGNITTANEAAARLVDYEREELIGMDARRFLSAESLRLAREIRSKLLCGEAVEQPYDQELIRKDGREINLKLTTSLIANHGQPTGFQNIARDVTGERRMQESLRYYVHQITRAQEEERKRIARELHDDTAQSLYALSRRVDNFTRSNSQLSPSDASFLKELREQIADILQGIRSFSQDLRPPILDDLGLLPALGWLVSDVERRCEIKTNLAISGGERRFPPEMELTLFRIVQEVLRNVERHAQATRAEVIIQFGEDRAQLSISDNGKGFQLSEEMGDLPRRGKLGLAGIEERARLLDGSLRIESELGKGTSVIIEVPYSH